LKPLSSIFLEFLPGGHPAFLMVVSRSDDRALEGEVNELW